MLLVCPFVKYVKLKFDIVKLIVEYCQIFILSVEHISRFRNFYQILCIFQKPKRAPKPVLDETFDEDRIQLRREDRSFFTQRSNFLPSSLNSSVDLSTAIALKKDKYLRIRGIHVASFILVFLIDLTCR